jgi:hypothetical protein
VLSGAVSLTCFCTILYAIRPSGEIRRIGGALSSHA